MGEIQAQTPPAPPAPSEYERVKAEFEAAIKAIHQDTDPVAVETLRRLARAYPKMAGRILGNDFARLARDTFDHWMSKGGKRKDQGALLARMEVMAAELAGDNPSVASLMVAELAAFNAVEVGLLNVVVAVNPDGANASNSKRRTAAQGRLLACLKTLSQIQACERPRHVIRNTLVNVSTDRQP